jgi:DNA-binding transcriptional regulator YbjK
MSIENRRQCENTQAKLRELEQLYERKRQEPNDEHVRELTLRSLKKRINQFKEEIARFEARTSSPARNG